MTKKISKFIVLSAVLLSLTYVLTTASVALAAKGSGSGGDAASVEQKTEDNLPKNSGIDSANDQPANNAPAEQQTTAQQNTTQQTMGQAAAERAGDDNLPKHSGIDSDRDVQEIGALQNQENRIFENNLGQGMKDDNVLELQKELAEQGFFKTQATGFFGDITKNAVREFQKSHNLPETGFVGPLTRNELNKNRKQSNSNSSNQSKNSVLEMEKQIQILTDKINQLQAELQKLILSAARSNAVTEEDQRKAGIIITGDVSGPGYPTGPLNMTVPASQLFLDRLGQAKEGEVKDRQYEAPLEIIPITPAFFPVTINGVANTANELKVISNLKSKNGAGRHQGTIDVDIDTIPGGHLTLAYSGTAAVAGSTIASKGTFKTAKTRGIFAGLIAEGTYEMTIVESGSAFGSPVTVSITTTTL